DSRGHTAFIEACFYGWIEGVETLIRHGADPCVCSQRNDSALWYAVRTERLEIIDIICADPRGRRLLELHESVWQDTPLHIASSSGLAKTVERLIAN
ncbi:ankyrin repeat domain-containing protein, partial [Heyndrickxia coagulans]|uniref:ankyrin repeat domain-containing protein n=1 Tax=Heyndrickxia coagulans TaxID=1398 RepID=UPI0034D60781